MRRPASGKSDQSDSSDTKAGAGSREGGVGLGLGIRTISSLPQTRSFHQYMRPGGGHVDYTSEQMRRRGVFQTAIQRQHAATTNACERQTSYLPIRECYVQLSDYCRAQLPPTPEATRRKQILEEGGMAGTRFWGVGRRTCAQQERIVPGKSAFAFGS